MYGNYIVHDTPSRLAPYAVVQEHTDGDYAGTARLYCNGEPVLIDSDIHKERHYDATEVRWKNDLYFRVLGRVRSGANYDFDRWVGLEEPPGCEVLVFNPRESSFGDGQARHGRFEIWGFPLEDPVIIIGQDNDNPSRRRGKKPVIQCADLPLLTNPLVVNMSSKGTFYKLSGEPVNP